jgi:transcription initiation factor IIF auxiliary subunit
MTIKLNNYAEEMQGSDETPYFRWVVFVDEEQGTLDRIKEVEYTLHPTFPRPVQVRSDPRDKFALRTAGWGEFNVLARVRFKDGTTDYLAYPLKLSKRRRPGDPALLAS